MLALAEARAVDERVSLKHVHKRLGALAKVLIVTTFMEDALRVLLTFSVQQQSMRIAGWQTPALHSALPVLSFCVQFGGSLLIVLPADAGHRAVAGCYILLGWCLFHPFMYKQQTNWEFMLETTTIMGGLLVLLSHEQLNVHASDLSLPGTAKPTEALKERVDGTVCLGLLKDWTAYSAKAWAAGANPMVFLEKRRKGPAFAPTSRGRAATHDPGTGFGRRHLARATPLCAAVRTTRRSSSTSARSSTPTAARSSCSRPTRPRSRSPTSRRREASRPTRARRRATSSPASRTPSAASPTRWPPSTATAHW